MAAGPGEIYFSIIIYMFDLDSKWCFHLRITADREKCIEVVKAFNQKWCSMAMLSAYEVVGDNKHSHSHIQFDKAQYEYHMSGAGKTARSAFFKKFELSGLFNFQQLDKEPIKNLQYCIKDMDIIYRHNVAEVQLEEIKNKVLKIQENMKKDSRIKVLESFTEYMKTFKPLIDKSRDKKTEDQLTDREKDLLMELEQLNLIAKFIHKLYIEEWDKEPPISRLKPLVLYVAHKYSLQKGALVDYRGQIDFYYEKIF